MAIPSPLLAFRYRVGIQMQMGPRWRQKPGTGQWSLQGAKGEGSRNGGDLWPGHLSPQSTKYATAEKPTRRHSVRKRQAQRWSQVQFGHTCRPVARDQKVTSFSLTEPEYSPGARQTG